MGAARGNGSARIKRKHLTLTGIDEGLISGTLAKTHFVHLLSLDKMSKVELANVKGNISAMVQIGSVGGAAL
jgi:hypothetical protein